MYKRQAVFPGIQGGPLEHVIAAKAVAFGECLQPEYKEYQTQVKKNAAVLAQALIDRGFTIVSGGTDTVSYTHLDVYKRQPAFFCIITPRFTKARTNARASMPECSAKRSSSVAISARIRFDESWS